MLTHNITMWPNFYITIYNFSSIQHNFFHIDHKITKRQYFALFIDYNGSN